MKISKEKDALLGSVHKILIEMESLVTTAEAHLRGQRVPIRTIIYDLMGREVEEIKHGGPETTEFKSIFAYHQDGTPIEVKHFNSGNLLVCRTSYKRVSEGTTAEELTYNADGSPINRTVHRFDEKGYLCETKNYDGSGTLMHSFVYLNNAQGQVSEMLFCSGSTDALVGVISDDGQFVESDLNEENESHDRCPDGLLISKTTFKYDDHGAIKEQVEYDSDDAITSRKLFDNNPQGAVLKMVEYGNDGAILSAENYAYELDPKGNWIRQIKAKLNAKTNTPELLETTYRQIIYY